MAFCQNQVNHRSRFIVSQFQGEQTSPFLKEWRFAVLLQSFRRRQSFLHF